MSDERKLTNMPIKNLHAFELTPGLAGALTESMDPSYMDYFEAASSGGNLKEVEKRIAAIPEEKRYLTRILDSLENAFADFDSSTAKLDLPNMKRIKPEDIKLYLGVRLQQMGILLTVVENYVKAHP